MDDQGAKELHQGMEGVAFPREDPLVSSKAWFWKCSAFCASYVSYQSRLVARAVIGEQDRLRQGESDRPEDSLQHVASPHLAAVPPAVLSGTSSGAFFEAKVVRELGGFIGRYDERRDSFWTATVAGRAEGSLTINGEDAARKGAHHLLMMKA